MRVVALNQLVLQCAALPHVLTIVGTNAQEQQ